MDMDHPPVVTITGEFVSLTMDKHGMIITKEADREDISGSGVMSLNREEASEFGSLYAMAVNAINSAAIQMLHEQQHHNPFAGPNSPFEKEDGEEEY